MSDEFKRISEELTRARLEIIRLRFELGVLSTEKHKTEVMLETGLKTKSREVDRVVAETIKKAASK